MWDFDERFAVIRIDANPSVPGRGLSRIGKTEQGTRRVEVQSLTSRKHARFGTTLQDQGEERGYVVAGSTTVAEGGKVEARSRLP